MAGSRTAAAGAGALALALACALAARWRRRQHLRANHTSKVMRGLFEMMQTVSRDETVASALTRMFELSSELLAAERITLFQAVRRRDGAGAGGTGGGGGGARLVATHALDASIVGHSIDVGQGIAGWVARAGAAEHIPDVSVDARFDPKFDEARAAASARAPRAARRAPRAARARASLRPRAPRRRAELPLPFPPPTFR